MTEVEQEKQSGLGAIMMTVNRRKVSTNSAFIICSVGSSQTPAIKNSRNYYAVERGMKFFFNT